MSRIRVTLSLLTVLSITVRPLAAAEDPGEPIRSAAVHDGRLICLYHDGKVAAWDLKTGAYAKDESGRLTRKDLTRLAADGDQLWAADYSTVYRWSAKEKSWEKVVGYDEPDDALAGLVPVDGVPLLVFLSKVTDPVGKRTFAAPRLKSDRSPYLRILALHGTGSMVWIGTGNGEWGGRLIGLDPKTGKWVEGNGSQSVTGITHSAADEIIVSWSTSHFGEKTEVCVHKPDGAVKTAHPSIEGKYYQTIAYNPHDKTLYGVEGKDVVTIKDGKPTKTVSLEGQVFENEPMAIGVAPGVRELIPIGPKAIAVIPKRGTAWLLREEKLTRLPKP